MSVKEKRRLFKIPLEIEEPLPAEGKVVATDAASPDNSEAGGEDNRSDHDNEGDGDDDDNDEGDDNGEGVIQEGTEEEQGDATTSAASVPLITLITIDC